MKRYPYTRRGYARKWCRVCKVIRGVRYKFQRDEHICLTCGARTTGFEAYDQYVARIISYGNYTMHQGRIVGELITL